MMLSRIAENLFWLGRYIERAEYTSRILEVNIQLLVDDLSADQKASAKALFVAMGNDEMSERLLPQGPPTGTDAVLDAFCYDPDSPVSIVAAMANGRENARRIRETISVELWESINTTYHAITGPTFRSLRPMVAFREVRERATVVFGTADHTMIHDDGWNFLYLGRMLERVDMTARLISVAAVNPLSPVGWSNALRACGAHHAYVRAFGGDAVGAESAAFLLLHHQFPRSVVYAMSEAEFALDQLHAKPRTMLVEDPAALLLGRALSDIEYQDHDQLLDHLGERMVTLQEACAAASDAIRERYFEGANAEQWYGGVQ